MEILLSAKNISKTFQGKKVLDNININVKEAEIVAISGASGAGKTTLLNILSTLDRPDENNSSSLFIDNHEVFNPLVFQEFLVYSCNIQHPSICQLEILLNHELL